MRCKDCPQAPKALICKSKGPVGARILILGQSPGHEELLAGEPFVGPSGRMLNAALLEAGIQPSQCRIMNTINCYPMGKGEKVTKQQFMACQARVEAEFEASDAEVVLALGGDALRRLGLLGQITRWRGHLIAADDLAAVIPPATRWVIPSLHPAFIMRQGLKPLPFLFEDVKRVKRALDNELNLVQVGPGGFPVLLLIPGPLALDIETNPETGIHRIGLATKNGEGIMSETWAWPGPPQLKSWLWGNRIKVGHNLSFDVLHLRRAGVPVRPPYRDTMWAGKMLQPDLDKNLDTMSSLYLDVPRWKHLVKESPEYYNRMDAHVTLALWEAQEERLRETGQLGLFEREMEGLDVLIGMTEWGVRVDTRVRDNLKEGLESLLKAARDKWGALAPLTNPGSPKQLRELLYGKLGLPEQRNRGQADPTTDKKALRKLLRKATGEAKEILATLAEIRDKSKLLSVYFQGGERVHPSYFPVGKDDSRFGTVTGRLSAQDPNIQQIHKSLRSM